MRALNAFTGSFYLETLQVARYTREMYCLFGGRHTHPSTIMPGGCSADITHQTLTDYYVRLMRYMDYCKRTVPMHDDLYDFFYEAMPGYEKVGYRDTDLMCWGAFDDPQYVDYNYRNMTDWGRHRFVTPGLVFKGELITTDLVEINLAIRILLGSSYFDDWTNEETFVTQDPLGNPVDKRHPWNKVTLPKPQARDWADKYSWVASPRMYDKRNDIFVANDTGGGPFARQWVTAKAGLVDIGYLKATGESIQMVLPKTGFMPEMELEWKIPPWSNAIERQRARSYHQAYSALVGLYNLEQALKEVRAGRTKSWNDFKVPESAVSVGFHEAARGVLSHHMVIRDGKIANYQPYPPTPWNGNPRDVHGTPGPYEDAVQNTPIFEENGPTTSRGSTSCGRSTASTRACPAGCTCTGRARSARSSTRRRGCADLRPTHRAGPGAHGPARGGPGLPGPRGRGRARRPRSSSSTARGWSGSSRRSTTATCATGSLDDGVVASLLLIHGLYPIDLETRVQRGARQRAAVHGVARRRRRAAGDRRRRRADAAGRPLRGLPGLGVDARAGDQEGARGDGARPRGPGGRGRERAARVRAAGGPVDTTARRRAWTDLDGEPPAPGLTAPMTVAGADVLVANVGGTLLAYRNACGWCRARLDGAPMTPGGTLTCPSCERRFELRRAGRSPDDDALQIAPVPLLRGEGGVRVAVA